MSKWFWSSAMLWRWTVAGRGAWDARRGFPGPNDWAGRCVVQGLPGDPAGFSGCSDHSAAGKTDTVIALSRLTDFEWELVDLGERDKDEVEQQWCRRRGEYLKDFEGFLNRCHHGLARQAALAAQHAAKQFHSPTPVMRRSTALVAMALMAAADVPLVHSALQLFREVDWALWPVAMGVSFGFMLLADALGGKLRQWDVLHKQAETRLVWALVSGLAGLSVGIPCLAMLRASALPSRPSELVEDVALSLAEAGGTESLGLVLPVALGGMQFLLVAAGVVLGFLSHHQDPALVTLSRDIADNDQETDAILRAWGRLAAQHDGDLAATRAQLRRIEDHTLACIAEYRHWNRRASPGREVPGCWAQAAARSVFRSRDLGGQLLPLVEELSRRALEETEPGTILDPPDRTGVRPMPRLNGQQKQTPAMLRTGDDVGA